MIRSFDDIVFKFENGGAEISESQIIIDEKLPNIHPGEILKEEFLDAEFQHIV